MAGMHWTEDEDAILMQWYGKEKLEVLAGRLPGRTADAIPKRIDKLGIPRVRLAQDFDKMPNWLAIEAQLQGGPKTTTQIAYATGIHIDRVRNLIATRRGRLVYVFAWTSKKGDGGDTAIYALGCAPDAKQPPKLTQAEKDRLYRNRLKKTDPEEFSYRRKRDRDKQTAKNRKITAPDIATNWMLTDVTTIPHEADAIQEEIAQETSLARQINAGSLPGSTMFPRYSGLLLSGS